MSSWATLTAVLFDEPPPPRRAGRLTRFITRLLSHAAPATVHQLAGHHTRLFAPVCRGYVRGMTSVHPRADRFATALRHLEDTGDSSQLRELFGPDPELLRPQVATGDDETTDVTRFWERYRSPFSEIHTEFVRVAESGELGVLEWVSRGILTSGRPIDYSGVSLLDFDEQGRIRRFATYFDTAAFLRPETRST